jgi:ParB family chromosome partitioning protein
MTEVARRKTGLGRGLSALLGDAVIEAPSDEANAEAVRHSFRSLPVSAIRPHPGQPRRHFDEAALEELAASIAQRGIIQPIVVRPHGHEYQIVAGERRWRAAQRARLHEVPVIVREFTDAETLEIALVENIQRQDLNAIEEAEAYRKLIDDFGHTQDALAKLVDKSRSHVSNLLRLLDLPPPVRDLVSQGALDMGHARALIGSSDPIALALHVVENRLSVRETERLAGESKRTSRPRRSKSVPAEANADVAALERQLGDVLGLGVKITHAGAGGTLTLSYSTLDQLDMICQRLSGEVI